ncbi:MAG: hypothetical protein EOP24_03970 [Hyphomicrobiales bacterium]|nr:MAG: hypothetical protein EOP24_03970 [Hyphomicrobiales bacterium]
MVDKQAKRAPGANPALSFLLAGAKAIILIVSLLAVFIVGWSVWRWYRPEHFLNAATLTSSSTWRLTHQTAS